MKNMKKVFALVLVAVMVFALSATAFAASIKIDTTTTDTHTYKVYEIFTGDLDGDTLSNVKYGKNYQPGDAKEGDPVPVADLEAIADARTFAQSIKSAVTGEPVATLNADNNFHADVAKTGYYLIVDATEVTLTDGDSYSAYIVQVAGDVEIAPKKDTTESDKKIIEDDQGVDEATTTDQVSIGDNVRFQLTGRIPSTATDYDYYYYILNDTLSEGLDFNNDVKVTVEGVETPLAAGTDYAVYTGDDADGCTFQIALLNAKALAGKTIIVEYTAKLNDKAVIGENANTNKFNITYSNNPEEKYDGTQDENHPGKPDSEKKVPTGETPITETETYTTGIEIQKVDQDGMALKGAEFTLEGETMNIVRISEEKFDVSESGVYYKLKNGSYTTEAPVTEDSMKEAGAGATAGYVIDDTYTGNDAITVGGITYRPYVAETDSDKTVYIYVKNNVSLYDSTTVKYEKTVSYKTEAATGDTLSVTAEVGEDGILKFEGLAAGTYTITETKTPSGYNTCDPITVVISFNEETGELEAHWVTAEKSEAVYDKEDGLYKIEIKNNKGLELPETGGIGTTIFYVLGGILMVGAVVLLITKKRVGSAR